MSYIGNTPFTAAFLVDTFSGNGTTVAFTMSVAPANTSSIIVAITGVVQDPSTYSVSGTTLTFSAAPPSGTSNISVRYLGIPASGVTTTAYRTVTDNTATAGQTTFTIPSYTVGYVDVYRNGVRLAAADYTATTGTTVVLASAASAGDTITTESFYVSSVLNAIQQYNGLSVNQVLTTPTANTLTSASGSNLQLQTNGGTTALTLDTAQNAGLGVTPSAWASGYKAFQIGERGSVYYSGGYFGYTNNAYWNGSSNIYIQTGFASDYYTQSGSHVWRTAASGTAGNAITFTQAMTLNASGQLGIGTTSPSSSMLHVKGNWVSGHSTIKAQTTTAMSSGGVSGYGIYDSDGTRQMYISADSATLNWWGQANKPIVFATNDTERARIESGGSLIVGTSATTGVVVRPTGYEIGSTPRLDINGAASTVNNTIMQCYSSGANAYRFYIQWNGQIYATQTTITGISDARLKENIIDLDVGLAAIMALRPRKFDWKEGKGKDIKGDRGFVAQEFELVFPDLIDTWKDPAPEGEEPYKSVRQELIPVLVKAIQEQQAIIEQLQADVAALKGQA